jgi:SAM-dependent methyltransferase
MTVPTGFSFGRYLAAKRTVDDRALNLRVWNALADQLAGGATAAPLRVLELGAGIGTMIERTVEWGLFSGEVVYTALDAERENIEEARRRLPDWGVRRGFEVQQRDDALVLTKGEGRLTVHLETADVFEFAAVKTGQQLWDLTIANAFMDLVNIPATLPRLFALLRPGGLFYFTVTFDGVTAFGPPVDPALDAQIEGLYHADMDARRFGNLPTGASQAGRDLLHYLLASPAEVLATGASDWVVVPGPAGYPADEAYFLHFIIHTIEGALTGHPALDADAFAAWVARRHEQIEAAELIYIAHQLDVLGRLP